MRKKRDYNKKNFQNPFFPAKVNGSKGRRKMVIFFGVVSPLILLIILSFFLRIKNINISGGSESEINEIRNMAQAEMDSRRFFIFDEHSLIFFNKNKLAKSATAIESVYSIAVAKTFPDTLDISINNKAVSAILISNGIKYYLDDSGVAIKIEDTTDVVIENGGNNTQVVRLKSDSDSYPTIMIDNLSKIRIGSEVIEKGKLDFILAIDSAVKKRGGFTPTSYTLNLITSELDLLVNDGWQVKFDAQGKALEQLDSLYLVLNNKVSDKTLLHYIDVRYGDKIFYQ
ncbi:MAG: hypothetical protein PHW95_04570 [Patescibacteria group bacterium]|nr:hypothetical protein [Patescibacteria group bacterium]